MCISDRFTTSHIFTLLKQFSFTWKSDRKITTLCSLFIDGVLAGEYFCNSSRVFPNESRFAYISTAEGLGNTKRDLIFHKVDFTGEFCMNACSDTIINNTTL